MEQLTKIQYHPVCESGKCTMCKACLNVCPVGAISFDCKDFEYRAVIMQDKCIHCDRCAQICPANMENDKNASEFRAYACFANDEKRIKSSSGGVFPLLAESFIREENGCVVGAVLEEPDKVKHVCAEKPEELKPLYGSKYLRSDLGETYRQIEEKLEQNKKILFCGTPCQVAAVKNLFGKYKEQIYTIDLLCRGVPKEMIVDDYLETYRFSFSGTKMKAITFRDKEKFGWACNNHVIKYEDGTEYIGDYYKDDIFQKLYHDSISLRDCCLDCKFAEFPRQADISLGDMWDLDKLENNLLNDKKGISKVIINSEKGRKLFEKIEEQLCECVPIQIEEDFINRLHSRLSYDKAIRDHFYRLMRNGMGLEKSFELATKEHYDVGIIGCWSVENHGSNMTYYALYKCLTNLGYDVLMIERPNSAEWKPHEVPTGFKKNPYPISALSKIYEYRQDMKEVNEKCDVFVLGSDQLLYHDLYRSFDEYIDMRYIHANKRKIAYATSLGRQHFEGTVEQRDRLSFFLQKYDAISIREQSTIDSLQEEFGIKAVWMPDPVFLIDKEEYEEIFELCDDNQSAYIGAYILDPSKEKESLLTSIAKRQNLQLKIFSDVAYGEDINEAYALDYDVTASNEDWLQAIKNCKYFITDSFHGTCFAIIFNKPFICIANRRRGYDRFKSLLEHFNLMDCLIEDVSELSTKEFREINFELINETIVSDRNMAQKWLKNNIFIEKRTLSDYDILDDRIDEISTENRALSSIVNEDRNRSLATESWLSNTHERVGGLEKNHMLLVEQIEQLSKQIEVLSRNDQIIRTELDQLHKCNAELENRLNKHLKYRIKNLFMKIFGKK